jgi:hypothetical protein
LPFQNSTSAALSQSISTAGAAPVLTIEPLLNRHGKVVNFALIATVQPTVDVGVTPTGTVTYFFNGRARYQTLGLTNGSTLIVRPGSHLLNHYVYVRYNGNSTYVAGASSETYISHRLLARLVKQAEAAFAPQASRGRSKASRAPRPR